MSSHPSRRPLPPPSAVPPLAVFLWLASEKKRNNPCLSPEFIISLLLTLLGWLPGVIFVRKHLPQLSHPLPPPLRAFHHYLHPPCSAPHPRRTAPSAQAWAVVCCEPKCDCCGMAPGQTVVIREAAAAPAVVVGAPRATVEI